MPPRSDPDALAVCQHCGRRGLPERIADHEQSCDERPRTDGGQVEIEDPFPMEIVGAEALIGTERPADGQECTHYYRGIGEVCTNDAEVVWVIGNPDLPAEEREPTRHPVCEDHHKLPDEALPDGVESGGDAA